MGPVMRDDCLHPQQDEHEKQQNENQFFLDEKNIYPCFIIFVNHIPLLSKMHINQFI